MNKLVLAGRSAASVSDRVVSQWRPGRMMGTLAAGLAAILTLGGCGSDGFLASFTAKTDTTSEHVIEPLDARKLGFSPQWPKQLPLSRGEKIEHAVLAGDLVVTVERPHNLVTATSFRDGSTVWRKPVGTELEILYPPQRRTQGLANDDRVLINSNRRMFSLRAMDGELLYVSNLDYPVVHAPAMIGEYAIFGGGNGRAFAHDIYSGFAKWEYQLPTEIRVEPVLSGTNAFVVDSRGIYAMLEGTTGEVLWKGRTFAPVVAKPAVGAAVYLASQDQTLYALDRNTGVDRWKFRETAPLNESPVVMGVQVFLPLGKRGLVAIDAAEGHELWRISDRAYPVRLYGDRLLLKLDKALRMVDAATGETIEEVATMPLKTVLVDSETGSIVLIANNGWMQRLDPMH